MVSANHASSNSAQNDRKALNARCLLEMVNENSFKKPNLIVLH